MDMGIDKSRQDIARVWVLFRGDRRDPAYVVDLDPGTEQLPPDNINHSATDLLYLMHVHLTGKLERDLDAGV